MSSGRVHLIANSCMLCAGATVAWWSDMPANEAVGLLAGMACATLITPDLDMQGTTRTERAALRVPILGDLFVATWHPYALRFKHRGLSHHWLFGTMTRVGYSLLALGFWWLWLVGIFTLMDRTPPTWAWSIEPAAIALFIIGWWLQDLIHLILDAL